MLLILRMIIEMPCSAELGKESSKKHNSSWATGHLRLMKMDNRVSSSLVAMEVALDLVMGLMAIGN